MAGIKKPDATSDADWDKQKKQITGIFDSVIATAAYNTKDWNGAADAYKTLIAQDATDAGAWSRLGVSLLQETPPQTLDGYWALAHAISMLKAPGDAQFRGYLKNQILRYQQVGCENLVDDEINSIVTLAATTPDRPATFTIPSSDDLTKARNDTANFIPWLREGGDHGKLMWLATCGLDYPEVVAKVISVDAPEGGQVVLHLCTGATPEETEACKIGRYGCENRSRTAGRKARSAGRWASLRRHAHRLRSKPRFHAALGQGQGKSGRYSGTGQGEAEEEGLTSATRSFLKYKSGSGITGAVFILRACFPGRRARQASPGLIKRNLSARGQLSLRMGSVHRRFARNASGLMR